MGVIEKDGALERWLRSRGHRVVLAYGAERPDVILVGEGMLNDGRLRGYGFELAMRVKSGSRLVLLEQQAWNPAGFEGKLLQGLVSAPLRVPVEPLFPGSEIEKAVGKDLDFRRLNGCEGIGVRVRLEAPTDAAGGALGTGQPDSQSRASAKPTLPSERREPPWRPRMVAYTRGSRSPDWALVHRAHGAGEIFACQVPLAGRIDPSNPAEFDPVAERLLAFLIESQPPADEPAAE